MDHSVRMTIWGLDLAVEILDDTRQRKTPSSRIIDTLPAPVAEWPLQAAEIVAAVEAICAEFGCRRGYRADVAWAIGKYGLQYHIATGRYYIRAVPTAAEDRENAEAARAEAADGLV